MNKEDLSLKNRRPDIFEQINHELTGEHCPEVNLDTISYGSNKKLWWNCTKDSQHVWESAIKSRTGQGSGCLYCAGHRVMAGNNDLKFLNPDLAAQWHPTKNGDLLPSHFSYASSKKVWWLCEIDSRHEWETAVKTRHRGRGCPVCSSNMIVTGINDLATTRPELASEWNYELNHPLAPNNIARSANKKVWWTCPKDERHVYQASINARDIHNYGCSVCAGRTVIQGVNDASTHYPELITEWHPTLNGQLKLSEVTPMSHKSAWWVCKVDSTHEWKTRISSRTLGAGCLLCSGKKIVSGINDLATLNPKVAAQWHPSLNKGVGPDSVSTGTQAKYWWQCDKDKTHSWETSPNRRKNRPSQPGSGCPKCIVYRTENEFRELFNKMTDLHFIDGKIAVKWSKRNLTQIDIFNEEENLCIEYDGLWSHGGKTNSPFSEAECLARDARKTKALIAAGYTVIRIRELGLAALPIVSDNFFQIDYSLKEDKKAIVKRCIDFFTDS